QRFRPAASTHNCANFRRFSRACAQLLRSAGASAEDYFFGAVTLLPSLLFFECGREESFALGFAPLSEDPVPARLLSLPEPEAGAVGWFCLSTAFCCVLVLLPPAGVLAGFPFVPSSLCACRGGFAGYA